ncbi:MAG: hypothetical protein AAFZ17_12695 [Cyanobacteria bacterium J06650_10]
MPRTPASRHTPAKFPSARSRHEATRSAVPLLSDHRRKVLWAGGAITLLAMATILPTQVSSQAIADNNCEKVVKSGAEVSRGQLSSLSSIPQGSTKEAVQQVLAEPYCTLPALAMPKTKAEDTDEPTLSESPSELLSSELLIERDAYPLAFDPEAWLVLSYHNGEYQAYDFVFKP